MLVVCIWAFVMKHSSQEKTYLSQSQLDDYVDRVYRRLKHDEYRVRLGSRFFTCPFCAEKTKQEYLYEDLLQHAIGRGRSDDSKDLKQRGRHQALSRFLERYYGPRVSSEPSSRRDVHAGRDQMSSVPSSRRDVHDDPDRMLSEPSSRKDTHVGRDCMLSEALSRRDTHTGGDRVSLVPASRRDAHAVHDHNEKFVWPWKGVLTNLPVELKEGRYVGASGSKLRDDLTQQGFNPLKVIPLWNHKGHSRWAIVDFHKDWSGFSNAIMFEKHYESKGCGKKDYYSTRMLGDNIYGWVAREEDYNSGGIVGPHLHRHGDLKSIADVQNEEKRKTNKLVSNLTLTFEAKKAQYEEMQNKLEETSSSLALVVKDKEEVETTYNEEMKILREKERDFMEKVFYEHEETKFKLEKKWKDLEQQWKYLKEREAHNEHKRRKLEREKKMNELARLQQKKADEKVLTLAAEHERKKAELHRKILELEQKLDRKQALELEIERMRGAVHVMQHLGEEGDTANKKKMEEIEEEMKEKEEELEDMDALNQTLILKERRCNDELQDARKALINVLEPRFKQNIRSNVGLKRMGQLNCKPFLVGAKRKYPQDSEEDVKGRAVELCSLWEDYLRDPSWHPFKIITENEQPKEVIDAEDEKLKELKDELGEESYGAVVTALLELNEYNPSGRYPVFEIWNHKEDRRARLKEGAADLMNQWKTQKAKRKRGC